MKSSLLVCYIFVIIELKSLNISLQILHHYFYIFFKETFFGEKLYSVGDRKCPRYAIHFQGRKVQGINPFFSHITPLYGDLDRSNQELKANPDPDVWGREVM
jgi:hypothetical protein